MKEYFQSIDKSVLNSIYNQFIFNVHYVVFNAWHSSDFLNRKNRFKRFEKLYLNTGIFKINESK